MRESAIDFFNKHLQLEGSNFKPKNEYWQSANACVQRLLDLQKELNEANQKLVQANLEQISIENDLLLIIMQDKRLSNETQRKAALSTAKLENEKWRKLEAELLPTLKAQVEEIKLEQRLLHTAIELCYIAMSDKAE